MLDIKITVKESCQKTNIPSQTTQMDFPKKYFGIANYTEITQEKIH